MNTQAFASLGITTLADYLDQTIWTAAFQLLSFILLFFINWRLALVMVLIAPIVAVIALKFHSKIHVAFKDVREQNAVLSTKTQENISGVRVVKAFAQE